MESGILKSFPCRIRNTAAEIPNATNNWNWRNPEKDLESSNWNPESTTWNPESKTVLDSITSCTLGETELRTARKTVLALENS